jgi:hypothetical protein
MKTEIAHTWSVWHGGEHHGMGSWERGLTSLAAARESARQCRIIIGGLPFIERDEPAPAPAVSEPAPAPAVSK